MIGAFIGLLLLVVLCGVAWWAIQQLLALVPLAEPFATIVRVLLVLIMVAIVIYVIVIILGMVGVQVPMFGSGSSIHLR